MRRAGKDWHLLNGLLFSEKWVMKYKTEKDSPGLGLEAVWAHHTDLTRGN